MADASGKFPGEPSRPQEKVHTAKKPGRVLDPALPPPL